MFLLIWCVLLWMPVQVVWYCVWNYQADMPTDAELVSSYSFNECIILYKHSFTKSFFFIFLSFHNRHYRMANNLDRKIMWDTLSYNFMLTSLTPWRLSDLALHLFKKLRLDWSEVFVPVLPLAFTRCQSKLIFRLFVFSAHQHNGQSL